MANPPAKPHSAPAVPAEIKALEEFLPGKKVLIADTSAVTRTAISTMLIAHGAKVADIQLANSYAAAEEAIESRQPHLVICDYNLESKYGLDLLQRQRFHNPESKNSLFLMVTGNTSQTAVARAAEEDVDGFVIKPFTTDVFLMALGSAVTRKIHPSAYVQKVESGKHELSVGNFDTAIELFEAATTLDPAPSLAYFYLGQSQLMKSAIDTAEGHYLKGLEYNRVHYRCLVGLYEVLMARQRFADAYEVVKRISRYFPANPQRLTAVLRLAIQTGHYEDIERYYQVFFNSDERNEEMVKYITVALVVCGRYFLKTDARAKGIELFNKAAQSTAGQTKLLREIILALVDAHLGEEALKFLKKFPPETHTSPEYLTMDFLVTDATGPVSLIIDKGRQLIARAIYDPNVYKIMLRRSQEAGLGRSVESLAYDAAKRWPDQKTEFMKYIHDAVR